MQNDPKKTMEAKKQALEEAKKALNEAQSYKKEKEEALSLAETNKKVADFALTRNKNNKAWLIILLIGAGFAAASVIISLYWLKSIDVHNFIEGFNYNGEPTFLLTIGLVLAVLGLIFFFVKISSGKKLTKAAESADLQYDAVSAEHGAAAENVLKAEEALKKAAKAYNDSEKIYFESAPEEKKKREEEKKADEEAALAELKRIEEINKKAAEDAQKRAADRIEADKMFEHPQAYVLDGKFENEHEVIIAAADLGSPEAQERVIQVLLGISYKNGYKPDVKVGEEKALAFAKENSAMYELLGKAFLYGEGELEKDEEKGLKYLEKAAIKGRQKAMIMAAICHYNGVGTEKDEEKARTFFSKAAKQGNEQAIKVILAMDAGQKLKF